MKTLNRPRKTRSEIRFLALASALASAVFWLIAAGSPAENHLLRADSESNNLDSSSIGQQIANNEDERAAEEEDTPDLPVANSPANHAEEDDRLSDRGHADDDNGLDHHNDDADEPVVMDLNGLDEDDEDGEAEEAPLHRAANGINLKLPATRLPAREAFPELHPALFEEVDGQLIQNFEDGRVATTTLDPNLQRAALATVSAFPIPYAAIAAIEVSTGKVLALVSYSDTEPDAWDLPLKPCAPSASVFKIVTLAALLEETDLTPETETCYHGGLRRLTKRNITGCPRRDNRCGSLALAMSNSVNSMVAKLTHEHLDRSVLNRYSEAFGYNRPIPFDLPLVPSLTDFPEEDDMELARAAAGFWHTDLSALHGALIAGTIANEGVMMQPQLVQTVIAPDGGLEYEATPTPLGKVVSPETATQLNQMMVATVRRGTARRTFNKWPRSWQIQVAGKTGSLTRREPTYLDYSWFVGFAPADNPQIAVAAMVANGELWHIRAPTVVRRVMYAYFRAKERAKAGDQT